MNMVVMIPEDSFRQYDKFFNGLLWRLQIFGTEVGDFHWPNFSFLKIKKEMAIPPSKAGTRLLMMKLWLFILLFPPYGIWRVSRLGGYWESWQRGWVYITLVLTCLGWWPGLLFVVYWWNKHVTNGDSAQENMFMKNRDGGRQNGPDSFLILLCGNGCLCFGQDS
jgi:hypothetical protein